MLAEERAARGDEVLCGVGSPQIVIICVKESKRAQDQKGVQWAKKR
jgi:hypothetical protein